MDRDELVRRISSELAAPGGAEWFAPVFVALLQELVRGQPVPVSLLAQRVGSSPGAVADLLRHAADTEWDPDGDVVGYGLTSRRTAHQFEIDGRTLYTWCAFDTLFFPALIGKRARARSACASTGTPVELEVAPDMLQGVSPHDAAVSMILPKPGASIREKFCCHVHFFESTAAGETWAAGRPGIRILSIRTAFEIGQQIASQLHRRIQVRRLALGPSGRSTLPFA